MGEFPDSDGPTQESLLLGDVGKTLRMLENRPRKKECSQAGTRRELPHDH